MLFEKPFVVDPRELNVMNSADEQTKVSRRENCLAQLQSRTIRLQAKRSDAYNHAMSEFVRCSLRYKAAHCRGRGENSQVGACEERTVVGGLIRESVSIAQLLAKEEKLKLSASDEAIAKFWLKNILGDLDGVKTVEVDGFRGLIYITVGKDNAK
jgi:hypothetical protein